MYKQVIQEKAFELHTFTNRHFFGYDDVWKAKFYCGIKQIYSWLSEIAEYDVWAGGDTVWKVKEHAAHNYDGKR